METLTTSMLPSDSTDKIKLEYVWLDGYQPQAMIRSKTMIVENFSGKLEDCPEWNFDGSSTK